MKTFIRAIFTEAGTSAAYGPWWSIFEQRQIFAPPKVT